MYPFPNEDCRKKEKQANQIVGVDFIQVSLIREESLVGDCQGMLKISLEEVAFPMRLNMNSGRKVKKRWIHFFRYFIGFN